ncbi:hypothetical protein [Streptomyces sp. CNQ085]|uniref:hypothetical protein n=1 Tax=Streptomyces sp. CNQ085 TaxID=2886944 RepID=UPI001F5142B3|nr:hypothetical protein [Streptomyces sp. CNQ085]MCI0383769.1 hypothetical protein [Streptomyces sp. CNQ085]
MPRYLRYVLLWLSCTSLSVTTVSLTVQFVAGTTRPIPPVARDTPGTVVSSPTASAEPSRSPTPTPRPTPSPTRRASSPVPVPAPKPPASPTTRPAARPTPSPTANTGGEEGCRTAGAEVRTFQTTGGRASIRFGSSGACLVSALPAGGFTAATRRGGPRDLTVVFTGDSFRSRIEVTSPTPSSYSVAVRESTV